MTGQLDRRARRMPPRDEHVHARHDRSTTATSCGCGTCASSGASALYRQAAGLDAARRRRCASSGPSRSTRPSPGRVPAAAFAPTGRLKTLLMDQGFLAGVGNIYADEALWRARLHPLRSGATLRPPTSAGSTSRSATCSSEAIERRGSSVDDYTAPEGDGEMQNFLNVYQRTGQALSALRPADQAHRARRAQHALLLVVPATARRASGDAGRATPCCRAAT